MRSLFLSYFLCLLAALPVWARPRDYSTLDRHALGARPEVERSLESLANYLSRSRPKVIWDPRVHFWTKNSGGDEATAREIFRWIADRVVYDMRTVSLQQGAHEAEATLRRRSGVCYDYALLFEALADQAGLQVAYVAGRVDAGRGLEEHAWNAVCIGGVWRMVDVCWAATGPRGSFDPQWFDQSQEAFLETHFPEVQYFYEDFYSFLRVMNRQKIDRLRRRFGVSAPDFQPWNS